MTDLNLEVLEARAVVVAPWTTLNLYLVGCGGTGSWLAPHLARLSWVLREQGKTVRLTFCDPDTVEAANLTRQHFCPAEIRRNKAQTLAARYSTAFGLDIAAVQTPFDGEWIRREHNNLVVLVGCVDGAVGRKELAKALGRCNSYYDENTPRNGWWLDCGNHAQTGQVLLGSETEIKGLRKAFIPDSICRMLPSPALLAPELLKPRREEDPTANLSCAELAQRNAQSLSINQAVASEATDYLLRLLITGDLIKFATYIDRPSGTARSLYTTPTVVGTAVGRPTYCIPTLEFTGPHVETGRLRVAVPA